MADCLVLGANGFLGSSLAETLAAKGNRVIAFDRFSKPRRFGTENIQVVKGDLGDLDLVRSLLAPGQHVFYFVSTTTPSSAVHDPTAEIAGNVIPLIRVLEASVNAGCGRFYFASTGGAIYGNQEVQPIPESAKPNPLNPYSIAKLAAEGYLGYFKSEFGLHTVALRISNPYGPGQHSQSQGIIPIVLGHLKEGSPVKVLGDGSMVRDYLYIDDLSRMITTMIDFEPEHDVYNLGSGTGTSVSELIELMSKVTGREPEVEVAPKPRSFVDSCVLDVSRFRDEFKAVATMPLREGISQTWAKLSEEV
ncbi:MAG: NAD-dependent epimerase/dehydratase family protein [Cryobacterium sp.]|nr:NAD-dependent epimerase/dehydratase family protein [Cryobacterium sp.]MCO5294624.1 NAD-dependent epimerase/dehydratase family protein [Homoserinimonas sp.]